MDEAMSKRIVMVRKSHHLSQQKFADQLGLTRNFIALLETNKRIPSNRTISDICREFSVNEEWLRTGEGDMRMSYAQKMGTYLSEIVVGDDEFIKNFIEIYMDLDNSSKTVLKQMAIAMSKKLND